MGAGGKAGSGEKTVGKMGVLKDEGAPEEENFSRPRRRRLPRVTRTRGEAPSATVPAPGHPSRSWNCCCQRPCCHSSASQGRETRPTSCPWGAVEAAGSVVAPGGDSGS